MRSRSIGFIGFCIILVLAGCFKQTQRNYGLDKVIGKEGCQPGEFREPIGIAIDSEGFIYVTDAGNNRIQKFSKDGKFIKTWGSKGSNSGVKV